MAEVEKRPAGSIGALAGLMICVFLAAVVATLAAPVASASSCSRFASPTGSDAASGSARAPFRTAQRLVNSLSGSSPVGCLRRGVYAGGVSFTRGGTANAPIVLARYLNEPAEVDGQVAIAKGADYVTVVGLSLNGSTTPAVSPLVNGNHATFLADDVTNDHTNICFNIGYPFGHPEAGRPQHTVIYGSRVHDCGRLPATNHEHGIYITFADDTVISHNWIVDNADRGVQLYPDAQLTKITDNLIAGNGEGLSFGGENGVSAGGSRVTGNVIIDSNVRYNVESFYPLGTLPGTDNSVTGNCIAGGALGDVLEPQVGFLASSNSASRAGCAGVPGLVGPESLVGRAGTPAHARLPGAAPPARFRLAVKLRSHLRGRGRRRCRSGRIRATVVGGDRRLAIRGYFYRDRRNRGRDTHPPLSRIIVRRHQRKTRRHRVRIRVRLIAGQVARFSRAYRECGRAVH